MNVLSGGRVCFFYALLRRNFLGVFSSNAIFTYYPHRHHTITLNPTMIMAWFRNSTTVKGLVAAVKAANNRRMPFPPRAAVRRWSQNKATKKGPFFFFKVVYDLGMYVSLRAFTDIFSGVFSSNAISITHTLSHSYDDNGLEKWWFRNTVTAVVKAANNRRMSVSPPELQLGVGAKAAELTNRKKGPFFSF